MRFPHNLFQKTAFSQNQMEKFLKNANSDLKIADSAKEPEIIFRFCYTAIIKLGIFIIAKNGYKVRSIPGHHHQILKSLGKITHLHDEADYLQAIRQKRNIDLYEGGAIITKKEVNDLLKITKKIFKVVKKG